MEQDFKTDYLRYEEEFDLKRYLSIFFRKRWMFFSILSIVMAITLIHTFKQIPVYRATATIIIENPSASLSLSETQKGRVFPQIGGKDYYNTQYEILSSSSLIKRVNEALGSSHSAEALRQMITISPVRNTRLVSVSADNVDPVTATKIANTLVSLYIEQNIESMLFMSQEMLKAFPDEAEEIERHTIYGQLKELSREETLESLPPIAQDPLLRTLKSQKINLETQLANLGKRYKDKHPKIVMLTAELKYINDKIALETDRILRSVKADLAGRLQANNIRVIDYAEVPKRPIKPQKMKNILYGLFLSTFLGIGAILFTEYLDETIKNQDDIEKKTNLSYLGYFPSIKDNKGHNHPCDFNELDKHAANSNSIRNIKTNIIFSAPQEELKTILVTSTIPQEGKSFIASYIAFTFAKDGTKTLLLDADIRKPTIYKFFGIERSPGLTNLLVEGISPTDVIKETKYENLYVLTSGSRTPNPLELLSSKRMKNLLGEFLETFGRIIIDTSPGLLLPDALVLSKLSDATIVVAKAGAVNRDAFVNLRNKFSAVNSKIIGVILNFFQIEQHSHYRHKYYYNYYKKYYSSAGV